MVVLYTLGMLALLTAGWQADMLGAGPVPAESARTATVLAVLGFGLLLAAPPFHLWLPSTAGQSHPYALAFVVLISQAGALFTVFRFFDAYAWLRENEALFAAARWVGIAIAGFAALWAMAQRSLARTAAYAVLADTAVILLAFSAMSTGGYELALGLSGARVVSLAVWALGASVLQNAGAGDTADDLSGIGTMPPATATRAIRSVFVGGFPAHAGPGPLGCRGGGGSAALAVVGGNGDLAAVRWTSTVLGDLANSCSAFYDPRQVLLGQDPPVPAFRTVPSHHPWVVGACRLTVSRWLVGPRKSMRLDGAVDRTATRMVGGTTRRPCSTLQAGRRVHGWAGGHGRSGAELSTMSRA
jgi:hypothetical protein